MKKISKNQLKGMIREEIIKAIRFSNIKTSTSYVYVPLNESVKKITLNEAILLYNSKKITDTQLVSILEISESYERFLLNEGISDKAGEIVISMAKKILDILSKAANVTSKIIDYAVAFISRTLKATWEWMKQHPMATAIIIGIMVFIVSCAFGSEASAAVQSGTQRVVNQNTMQAMQGLADKITANYSGDSTLYTQLHNFFEVAKDPNTTQNTSQLHGLARTIADGVFKDVTDLVAKTKQGSDQSQLNAGTMLEQFQTVAGMTKDAIIKMISAK